MKQHKNVLNPGPLTESGYSGRNYYQANLPDNNLALLELPVEGQKRLKPISRRGSPGIERVKADSSSHLGLKLKAMAQTGNPGIIHLYPLVKSPGFLDCLDMTKFRRRNVFVEANQVKPFMEVLYTNSSGEIPIKSPGYLECLDESELRRRTISLETDTAKTELVVLYPNSRDESPIKSHGFLNCLDVKEFRRRKASLDTDTVKMELVVSYPNSRDEIPIKSTGFLNCLDVKEFRRRKASLDTDTVKTELVVSYPNSRDEIPIKSTGFLDCLDVKEFRRRIAPREADPARTKLEVLYPNSKVKSPNPGIISILHDIALKPPGRNIFSFSLLISHRTWKVKFRLMGCFRWRKTLNLPELVFSLKKLESLWRETKSLPYWVISLIQMEFTFEAKYRLYRASKLRLCQS